MSNESENKYKSSGQRDADIQRVDEHVNQLMEHFDSVQIFVSRNMPSELDGTITVNRGGGNWLTRYGQITEWKVYENERIRQSARDNSAKNP